MRPRAAAAAVALAVCAAVGAHAAPTVDYLYAEANEGGSSGGHVALRLERETFHFQQAGDGLLRLRRDDAAAFDFHYAVIGNRPVHEQRVAVAPPTFARLRDTFTRRLLVQDAQFGQLDALRADLALLDLWPRRAVAPGEPPAVAVRAAAYFLPATFADGRAAPAGGSAALAGVRARLAAAHGPDYLARRAATLRATLAAFRPRAVRAAAPRLARDVYPSFAPTAATVYTELLEGLTALEVLDAAPGLRPDSVRQVAAAPPLRADERRLLAAFAEQLAGGLAALAASPRADFGYPLLLGLARLAAIEQTLAGGRVVVLDAFAPDAPRATLPDDQRTAALAALADQMAPRLASARAELFAQPHWREADYTRFEMVANRVDAIDRSRAGAPLPLEVGGLPPSRPARRTALIAPALPPAELDAERAAAAAAERAYRRRLGELYGYHLTAHNCVHALFATIDAGLAEPGGDARAASRAQLGGVVELDDTLNFIPFVSAAAVGRAYAVVERRTRPSHRQQRLAALAAAEPAWRVALRESNTLTATVYQHPARDSAFLFFTDGAVAVRPLLGAANLLYGLGASAVGLATWPGDGGARLDAGLRGMLYSLPELAFVNLRKGTMLWVDAAPVTSGAGSPRPRSS